MCWDQQTSIITFILGTVCNLFIIFYFKEPIIALLAIIWEWLLLMQLFEAIAWGSQPKDGDGSCSDKNKIAANGALIANVTQPIIAALVLIAFTPVSTQNKVIALMAVFAYICWLIYSMNQNSPFECLTSSEDCSHLDYVWWKKFPGGGMVHAVVSAVVFILLIRPIDLAWFVLLYFV